MNLLQQDVVIVLDSFLAKISMSKFPTVRPAFSVSHEGNVVIPAHSADV